ncbi:hypothetical protein MKEN_00707400 [Mycena kentingensis (nom. inval.)]|nr:hypothetical protein MKEN_00707400 [Mycena kentingensis (nom. inval.)]
MITLPLELLHEITRYLPAQGRALLGVSRILHQIALQTVFSTVKIFLIHGEPGFDILNTESERYVAETSEWSMHRSFELLHHIITTQDFAKIVKTLSVHAFTDGPQVFELRTLSLALKAMSNLQSLSYFGDNPSFSHIAPSVPTSVRYLKLQALPEAHLLSHLDQLHFLQAAIPFVYVRDQKSDRIFAEWDANGLGNPADLANILESNPIRELVVLSAHLPLLPVWLCTSLTQLDICVTNWELVGTELLFRHAVQLEALSLVGYIDSGFFASLPADPAVLPRLTSFRISCEGLDEDVELRIAPYLREFLERRDAIRRLYIRLPEISLSTALMFAELVAKLPNIRVLGLHMGYEPIHETAALLLAEHLSPRLEALHLNLPWLSDLHVRTWYPILNKLQQLPDLTFLSLFSSGEDPIPIHPRDLAIDLPRLCLLGLQRSLFTVDRESCGHENEFDPLLWAPWTVKYCLPEDFESQDHAWLFRYH